MAITDSDGGLHRFEQNRGLHRFEQNRGLALIDHPIIQGKVGKIGIAVSRDHGQQCGGGGLQRGIYLQTGEHDRRIGRVERNFGVAQRHRFAAGKAHQRFGAIGIDGKKAVPRIIPD